MALRLLGEYVSMKVDNTIKKWFEETFNQFKNRRETSRLDILLCGVLKCAQNYAIAVITLIDKGHKLPAKALLRILCELTVKLIWCFQVPENISKKTEDVIYDNFRKWDKGAHLQYIKLLEKLVVDHEERESAIKSRLQKEHEDMGNIKLKGMPNVYQIFEVLAKNFDEEFKNEGYAKLYLRFNSAVHLDTTIFGELAKLDGRKVICSKDCQDDPKELLVFCIEYAYNINLVIRDYHSSGVPQMKKEREEIMCELSKERN